MADDTRRTAVVASLKATANVLHARPLSERNDDWADLMAANLAAAGLLAAPQVPNETVRDVVADVIEQGFCDSDRMPANARAALVNDLVAELHKAGVVAPADDEAMASDVHGALRAADHEPPADTEASDG
jgi:hypothetical protein